MTNTKMLESLNAYIDSLDEHDQEYIALAVKRDDIIKEPVFPLQYLANVVVELRRNIRAECAKTSGTGNLLKLAEKIMKTAVKDDFKHAIIFDGAQYFCDGFRALQVYNPFDMPGSSDFGIRIAELITTASHNPKPLELPTLADLKYYIAEAKTTQTSKHTKNVPIMYDFGESLPGVNADWLKDLLEAMPNSTATWNNEYSAIHFKCETAEAIILPINKKRYKTSA